MPELFLSLLELGMFFILVIYNFQIFQSLDLSRMFKKGHTKQVQLFYIFSVIIFSYFLTQALMGIIKVSNSFLN